MEILKKVMEVNPFYKAPVEIIIPFHNEHSKVVRLIESIFKTVIDNFYLITLIDDASVNKFFIKEFEKTSGVRCFRNEKKKGFEESVNFVLSEPYQIRNNGFKTSIPWVLIMKPDTFAENNKWLSNLGNSMYKLKSDGIKMIAAKTGDKTLVNEDVILENEFLPYDCVLAHRDLFSKVGNLTNAEDYAKKMKSKGFGQAVCGSSWVNRQ